MSSWVPVTVLLVSALCLGSASAKAKEDKWISEIFKKENENRALHGVNALELDGELSKASQAYADKLAEECTKQHHSPKSERQFQGSTAGENLYYKKYHGNIGSIHELANKGAPKAAEKWYAEVDNYPWPAYTGQDHPGKIGHFTQQVWKGSKLVGYGLGSRDGCKNFYVVARYWPGGNVEGTYLANVLPRTSGSSD